MKTLSERMGDFARKESVYILLLVFIILVNVLILVTKDAAKETDRVRMPKTVTERRETFEKAEELLVERRAKLEGLLRERKDLYIALSLTSVFIVLVILLGLLLDIAFLSFRLEKMDAISPTLAPPPARWDLLDVARVVILFVFFAYVIVIIESLLALFVPFLKNDNLRMMMNSSIMDVLTVIFVISFTVVKYKERLSSLGLTLKNFLRNLFYGAAGYVALVPVLIVVLMAVFAVVNAVKYVPEKQPVVELFLKEENPAFLAYTSVFASVFGPFIEELFFRGFMYNALKKVAGVFWSVVITASIFAALHTNVVGFLPIMTLGVFLAYLYEKTGTIISSITVHIIHNLAMVYLVFLIKELKLY
jgi:membrane protease YdiL (CAAX protease family)